jgi:hypothetical protein
MNVDIYPNLLSMNMIVEKLKKHSIKERVLKINEIAGSMLYYLNAYDYRDNLENDLEVHNLFKLLNIYGYGVCKQSTLIMNALLDYTGIPNQVLYIGKSGTSYLDHFVIEVFWDNQWHLFDPMMKCYFIGANNTILSAEALSKEKNFTIVGELNHISWLLFNSDNYLVKTNETFQENYFLMYQEREVFTLIDKGFPYKKDFMEKNGLTQWYCNHEKSWLQADIVGYEEIDFGLGVVEKKRIISNKNIQFSNYIIHHKPKPCHTYIINDYPLLIVDIYIELINDSKPASLKMLINGDVYQIDSITRDKSLISDTFLKNNNLFEKPIYSFYIESTDLIESIYVTAQTTKLKEKIIEILDETIT